MAAGWHARDAATVVVVLQSASQGLTGAEAARRLARDGANVLRMTPPVSAWRILAAQFRGVVIGLLLTAALLSLLVREYVDAAAIGVVLLLNAALGFATELRARRAIEALSALEPRRAVVIRDGQPTEIDASGVVCGDVIVLDAGAAVPADARVLATVGLRMNEAPLTGESLPVTKRSAAVADDVPLAERHSMVFAGTTTADGSGRAVVVATGMATELGRIGSLVSSVVEERSPLERRLDGLGRRLVWLALGVALLVTVLGVSRGHPLMLMLSTGLAIAVAAVPEGLPAVATIALAVGVRRMARRRALVRRLPSVESLGAVTVICTDKTGTLTAGAMTATHLWVAGQLHEVTGTGYAAEGEIRHAGERVPVVPGTVLHDALCAAVLAGRGDAVVVDGLWVAQGDPTDVALRVLGRKVGLERSSLLHDWPEVGEVPFSSDRRYMATFHRTGTGEIDARVKGALSRVLELCGSWHDGVRRQPLDEAARARWQEENAALARNGLRVLALASGTVREAEEAALGNLTLLGLVGITDPPADGVANTVADFRRAGIRTVMITGDQALTAEAIGLTLGLFQNGDGSLDGRSVDAADDVALGAHVQRVAAFSRVSPEGKLRIVAALQAQGDIVAVLGDGVNDAAALRKADVGVAMGRRGTDVAREAADVVLQDDDFRTIGAAIEEGRVIDDNIRRFVFYLFSCNLAEIFVLLGATLAGWPVPLTPLQILWMNLVTDTFPALALAVEPPETGVMARHPRDPQAALLSGRFLRAITWHALLMTVAALAAYRWALDAGDGAMAMTVVFMTLALAQLLHLGNARSRRPVLTWSKAVANGAALAAVVSVVALQVAALHVPLLARTLGTVPLDRTEWLVVILLAAAPAIAGQMLKAWRHGLH